MMVNRLTLFWSVVVCACVADSSIPLSCLCPEPSGPTNCPTAPNQCGTNLYILQYSFKLQDLCGHSERPAQCDPLCAALHYANKQLNKPPLDGFTFFPAEYQGSWANFFTMWVMASPGAQPGEIAYIVNDLIQQFKAMPHQTSEAVFGAWVKAWSARADAAYDNAMQLRKLQQTVSAQMAFNRAFLYYFAAQWPTPSTTAALEAKSLQAFKYGFPEAQPFTASGLQAYFTATTVTPKGQRRPVVLITGGLDSFKETIYSENGVAALKRGYHLIVYDGPGQGASTRGPNANIWAFRPDWENVTTTVLDVAYGIPSIQNAVDWNNVIYIGISLGGYLNGRSCAYSKPTRWNISACVLDTGVVSASKLLGEGIMKGLIGGISSIGSNKTAHHLLPEEYRATLNNTYESWYVPTLNCPLGRGELKEVFGNVHSALDPDSIYTAYKFAPSQGGHSTNYTQLSIATVDGAYNALPFVNKRIPQQSMPTLIFGGTEDNLAGDQVHDYFNQLPKNPLNKLLVYNSTTGAALHCQIGAFAVWEEATFRWLDHVLNHH